MAESSATPTISQRCDLCGCDRAYAWPRVPLPEAEEEDTNSYFSHFEPKMLSHAILSGCRACAFLKEGIERFETLDPCIPEIPDEIDSGSDVSDADSLDSNWPWICYRDFDKGWVVSLRCGKEDKSKPILEFIDADIESQRFISAVDSNSPSSLLWAKDLLLACKSNHQKCIRGSLHPDAPTSPTNNSPSGRLDPALPTRVLDLGPSNYAIKIWVTPSGSIGEYACLSHCWGDHQPLRTLSNNLELFTENIPWSLFPKTFQDAIVFARSLGFKYLWIDSLCIIQDDNSDWQREAANMASVYQNSFLTLSATGSPNCECGLFYKYPDPQIYTLTAPNTNGIHREVFVRPRTPHWDDSICVDDEDPLRHSQDYPLLHRAWAYQERLLSPRVLHFCKTELVWECMERWTCQCGSFDPIANPKKDIASFRQPEVETVDDGEPTSLGEWATVVRQYSALDLTYVSDRLPALAGLAEHMHLGHRGRYLAGLWEDSLARDLVWARQSWKPDQGLLRLARPSNSSLPTWSWGSISSGTWFPRTEKFEQMCDIVQVECALADSSNPRGNVTGGMLVVRGHVIEARLSNSKLELLGDEFSLPEWTFHPDYDISLQGPGYVEDGELLFCLTVGHDKGLIYCLALRCINEEKQVYERIGIVHPSSDQAVKVLPDWNIKGLEPGARELLLGHEIPVHKEIYCVDEKRYEEQERRRTWFADSLESVNIFHDYRSKSGRTVIAKLTAEQAAEAKKDPSVWLLSKKTSVPLNDQKDAKWYLSPQNEERKARGEMFREYYLGKVVTIV